mmetsp:Transcript_84551/g.217832  ORF Transcript_84551/g.217832 Transcript_84551/m.217832 type:complete len:239 (+) Transcript_84551:843-1559(+)
MHNRCLHGPRCCVGGSGSGGGFRRNSDRERQPCPTARAAAQAASALHAQTTFVGQLARLVVVHPAFGDLCAFRQARLRAIHWHGETLAGVFLAPGSLSQDTKLPTDASEDLCGGPVKVTRVVVTKQVLAHVAPGEAIAAERWVCVRKTPNVFDGLSDCSSLIPSIAPGRSSNTGTMHKCSVASVPQSAPTRTAVSNPGARAIIEPLVISGGYPFYVNLRNSNTVQLATPVPVQGACRP